MLENVEYVKADSLSNTASLHPDQLNSQSSHPTNIEVEPSIEKVALSTIHDEKDDPYWLSDCLEDAKNVIVEYYEEKPDDKNFVDCKKFLVGITFEVKLKNNGYASGKIELIKDQNQTSYKIWVHDILKEDTRNNRRMITIVLIHQLLHAIHPHRMHDTIDGQKGITRIEHELANRAGYHDALLNLENLHHNEKMKTCYMG